MVVNVSECVQYHMGDNRSSLLPIIRLLQSYRCSFIYEMDVDFATDRQALQVRVRSPNVPLQGDRNTVYAEVYIPWMWLEVRDVREYVGYIDSEVRGLFHQVADKMIWQEGDGVTT